MRNLVLFILLIGCLSCEEEDVSTSRTINVGYRIEVTDSTGAIGDNVASYSFIGPNFQRSFSDDLKRMPVILDRFMEVDSGSVIDLELHCATAFQAFLYENNELIWQADSDSIDVEVSYQYQIDLGFDSLATYPAFSNYRLEIEEKYPEWDDIEIMYARDTVILGTDIVEISNIRDYIANSFEGSFSFTGQSNSVAILQASGRQGIKMILYVEGNEIEANFARNPNGYANGIMTYIVQ